MEKDKGFNPKPLALTYEQFEDRGATIQNMMIDKYIVYDLIGMGSYGSVYRGMDDQTKKEVAIKLINMKLIKTDRNETVKQIKLRLCESQPRLMYMCDSPFLLKCYDVYENSDLKVLMIQYCNGKTLQQEIEEKKRIPEKQAWIILKHIINGLVVLHSHKIVHRDLKAENIMSHNGTYKIIDFGFSKKLQISQQTAQCRNTSLGTITTMAPEVMGRKPYGLKADIWSIGIIFFQMIYGQYPYDSSTAAQMYREIQVKKLFNKEKPFSFNGYTPTQDAFNFLRKTVVVETDKRADWRAVSEYPNIKNSDDLSQRFIKQCDVKLDTQNLDYNEVMEGDRSEYTFNTPKETEQPKKTESKERDLQNKLQSSQQEPRRFNEQETSLESSPKPEEPLKDQSKKQEVASSPPPKKGRFNLKETIQQEKRQQEARRARIKKAEEEEEQEIIKNKKRFEKTPAVRKIDNSQLKQKQKQVNRDEEHEYQWTRIAHLECLKTQFVFQQIVYPLEAQVLSSDDRSVIEFYYLLSARCFNNMSPIREQLQQRERTNQNRALINNLNDQIKRLYNQVHEKFIAYSNLLTEKENKTSSMIKDWFSKKFATDDFKEKDRFLTGIQKVQYTKEEQIKFTFSYYYQNLKAMISKSKNSLPVQRRLNHYPEIMLISFNQLRNKGLNFQAYVERVTKEK